MRLQTTLTRVALAVLMLLMVFSLGTISGFNPTEEQTPWYLGRIVTTNDVALTTATRAWTNVSASDNAIFIPVKRGWTWMRIAAIGYGDGDGAGDPSAGTFNYRVFAVRKLCSAELVCTGSMAVGGLTMTNLPYGSGSAPSGLTSYLFVEGPPSCTDYWSTGVSADGTTDDLGSISFATNGSFGVGIEITAMANVTSVYVLYTGGQ